VRCYLPSTGTVLIVIVIGAALLHGPASHIAAGMGTIAMILALTALVAGLFTGTILTTRAIQRRRAAAGGCVSCRFQCQRAITSTACVAGRGRGAAAQRRPMLVGIYTGEQQPPPTTPSPHTWPQIAPANASAGSGNDRIDGVDGVAGTAQDQDRARSDGNLIPT
jgi:hypothetical protein